MDGNTEEIRQQLEATKTQLTEKLGTLEQQVAETVQSTVQTTGAVVNATVDNVHETVESVTGAVQDAVKSVGSVFDIRGHVNAHPWLAIGGAVAFGFLAARRFGQPKSAVGGQPNMTEQYGQARPDVVAAAVRAAYESGRRATSPWRQLQMVAVGALGGLAQDVAARAGSAVWQRMCDQLGLASGDASSQAQHSQQAMDEEAGLQIHQSEGTRPDNPWESRRQRL